MSYQNQSILRRTAAEIVAAALYELYPNIELLGGGESDTGFFYEFHAPFPVHQQIIEEKIRQIVKERRPIRMLEMIGFSAAELLRSEGLLERAEEVGEGLVEIIEIGSFHDLCIGPYLKNTAELAAFKISLKEGCIEGVCHSSKEGLKSFLKQLDSYVDPKVMGERMGYWKGDVWLPKGIEKRNELIEFFRRHFFQKAFEVRGPLEADRLEMHRQMGKEKVAEIWTFPYNKTHIQVSFFNRLEVDVISCLHSIAKTLIIIGFDQYLVSEGKETDYKVEDGLGRSQTVISVKRISKKGAAKVDFYLTLVVENVLSLIIEKNLNVVELENQ